MDAASVPQRLIVGITGASGIIYGIRLLERLRGSGVETHLVMSQWAARTLVHETPYTVQQVQDLAGERYAIGDVGAAIASGSFLTRGMIVVPCSMRTLGAIAHGVGDNLIHRAADVTLKEGRKLVIVPREAPYNTIHLENMLRVANAGARIIPASPGFYHRPQTITELVDHLVFRILDQFNVPHSQATRWQGTDGKDQRHENQ